MKELILKITNVNWDIKCPGAWDRTEWNIYNDYTVDCQILFVAKDSQIQNTKITEKIYEELMKNLELVKNIDTKVDACDGEAWEFVLYNNGNEIWKRELGYIYGIEPLEKISDTLRNLISYVNEDSKTANEIFAKLNVKIEELDESRLDDVNAILYTPKNNQRGLGGIIIADDGSYYVCGSIRPLSYYIEEFKNGKRNY